jgi:hypothetical protein
MPPPPLLDATDVFGPAEVILVLRASEPLALAEGFGGLAAGRLRAMPLTTAIAVIRSE